MIFEKEKQMDIYANYKTFKTEFAGRPLVVETGKFAGLASRETGSISSLSQSITKKNFTPSARSPAASSKGKASRAKRRS